MCEEYVKLKDDINKMQVVNDPAERAVKDIQDFVMLTHDKEYRDNIVTVARTGRKKFAKCRKLDLNQII